MKDHHVKKQSAVWMALGVAALLSVPALASDDDLAVVKKAVASPQAAVDQPAAAQEPLPAPAPRKSGKAEAQWLRIRAFEKDAKGETHKRVSVNLPLSLVRALDDFPIDICHHRWHDDAKAGEKHCNIKLADVLAALDTGESLVEVEGDDQTVKIWVE